MDDIRQGVTPAGHAVLDAADAHRRPHVHQSDLMRAAAGYATDARSGDLASRRQAAIMAGAFSLLAIEAIDEDLARPE